MNIKEFELKGTCYICDRPFHHFFDNEYASPSIIQGFITKTKRFYCDCKSSVKSFYDDGYHFYLPLSPQLTIHVNTASQVSETIIWRNDLNTYKVQNTAIYRENDIPDFILTNRFKLIEKIKDLIVFS